MTLIQSRCQQPVGSDHGKIAIIWYGYKNSVLRGVRLGKRGGIPRIDFDDIGFFVNDLGLVIAQAGKFVGELIVGRLFDCHANQFGSSQRDAVAIEDARFAFFVGEGIEGPVV